MSKKLVSVLLLSALFLSSCKAEHPKFHAGECYGDVDACENWEKSNCHSINLVLEVGKTKYHIYYLSTNGFSSWNTWDDVIGWADDVYVKTECPQILKNKYNEYKSK